MRSLSVAPILIALSCWSAQACDLIEPKRQPALAEKVAGLNQIFGGIVIGYETTDGSRLMGPLPGECLNEYGTFVWWDREVQGQPACAPYLNTTAALFRVDVPIVGPAANDIASVAMTWGDGDCNTDFGFGDKWLIAGFWFTQELRAPIRDNEINILQRLAARPKFDFTQLYR